MQISGRRKYSQKSGNEVSLSHYYVSLEVGREMGPQLCVFKMDKALD